MCVQQLVVEAPVTSDGGIQVDNSQSADLEWVTQRSVIVSHLKGQFRTALCPDPINLIFVLCFSFW